MDDPLQDCMLKEGAENAIGVELGGQKCFPARENLCLNEDSRAIWLTNRVKK